MTVTGISTQIAGDKPGRITVLVVDDHPLMRDGIASVLASERDIVLVAEATNGREAVEQYRTFLPDVTIMDLQMPDMNGHEAVEAIRREFDGARIMIVTTYAGDVQASRALKAGAAGYLLKSKLRKDLPDAIRAVHAGKKCIPDEIARTIVEHSAEDELTPREIEVLRQVAAGHANKEIAAQLWISTETVKTHIGRILSKLGARDRTHAAMIAIKRGIIEA